jgi:FkbM family methyltransferase
MLRELFLEADSPTFVDIGAHIGYFTVYAGSLLGRRGSVVSIEPNRDYYRQLLKNIEINCLRENTKTFQIALSNKTGKAEMGGWEDRDFIEFESGKIDVMTFDQLCEIEGIKPDIVKIDVHGAEYKVLSGMTRTLDNHVKHLFLETHSEDIMQGYNIPDVVNFFDGAKFELFKLSDFRLNMTVDIVPLDGQVLADTMLYIRRR